MKYEMNRQLQAECGLSLADYTVTNALFQCAGATASTVDVGHHQRVGAQQAFPIICSALPCVASSRGWHPIPMAAPPTPS
jgi:hypothetical protein